jgi:polyisoprenoid-binding protein YceI
MKRSIFTLLSMSAMVLMSFVIAPTATTYKVDTSASVLKWTGFHLAKSYEHTGLVQIKSGEVSSDGSMITSATVVVDMSSISNTDLTSSKDNAKLVNHLKSDDFFGVEKYPEAKIMIKSSKLKSGNVYNTVADLTIRGITKEVAFETTIEKITDSELVAIANMKIKRTDFEVMYGWSVENAMLDGEFNMEVKIVAKK